METRRLKRGRKTGNIWALRLTGSQEREGERLGLVRQEDFLPLFFWLPGIVFLPNQSQPMIGSLGREFSEGSWGREAGTQFAAREEH